MAENKILEKGPELLKDLYSEVYQLVRLGLNHSALSMMSVLLEATLKELVRKQKGKYPSGLSFGQSIDACRKDKIISDSDVAWLRKFNDMVRNSYLHHDVNKIAKNMKIEPAKLQATTKKDFDRLVAVALFEEVDKFVRKIIESHFSSIQNQAQARQDEGYK